MSHPFSEDEIDHFLTIGTQAAKKASLILKEKFLQPHDISFKEGRHNLVTEADTLSETLILNILRKNFPTHAFLAEESGSHQSHENAVMWVIDPLDGTVNFAHGIPFFSISIAACYNKKILCSLVYAPMTDELFHAKIGRGAFLNSKKLSVSNLTNIEDGFYVTGFPYNAEKNPGHCIEHFVSFIKKGVPIRRLGSAALDLAYVAAGRFDGFWEVSLEPWDFCAAALLIQEAQGIITTYTSAPLSPLQASSVLASNPHLHKKMHSLIQTSASIC